MNILDKDEKYSRKTFRFRLEEMTNNLRDEIITGKRAIGDFLPSELDLAKQYHLSNKTVRKGLEVLVNEGLLEKIPKIGNRVASPAEENATIIRFGYHTTINRETDIFRLISDFEKCYPHIKVRGFEIPDANYIRYVQEYMESDTLDVVTMNHFNFREFIENNSAHLLEPSQLNSELYPFLAKTFSYKEEQLAQPFVFSPVILCYNKTHFAKKNVPEPDSSWSWTTLLEHAEQLAVDNQRFGFYFSLFSRNRWPLFLMQSGVRIEPDEQGLYTISGTNLLDGFKLCRSMIYHSNVFPTMLSASNADAEELFLAEKVSMIATTYFGLNELKDAKFPFDVAPLPYLYDFKTLLAVIGLAVNRKSKVKEASRLLVEFLNSPQSQLMIRQHTLTLPARKSAAEWNGEEILDRPSRFPMFREIIPTFKLPTDLGLTPKQLYGIFHEVKLYWTKLQDLETTSLNIEQLLNTSSSDNST